MSDRVFEILNKYGEADRANVWQVQSATVIKHACLERVAAKAGVVFDKPTVLRAERDEAVILVTGSLEKRSEWSIGEALINVNYRVSGKQAAYVFAMAEKRAKDRVILKLIGLHGLAYSEDEADDFKEGAQAPQEPRQRQVAPKAPSDAGIRSPAALYVQECLQRVARFRAYADLGAWYQGDEHKARKAEFELSREQVLVIRDAVLARKAELEASEARAA